MKNLFLFILVLIILPLSLKAQYAGGNGRGEFMIDYTQSIIEVTATSGNPGGSYSTLKEAFDRINDGTHKGAITITVNASTTESASASLNASGSGSASYSSVTIYPAATGLSINGTLAAPLINLNGADNVTINGSVNGANSGKDLTITNLSSASTAGTATIRVFNDASNNTVKYCQVKGCTQDPAGGVINFGTASTSGNSSNTIDHNDITSAVAGIRPINAVYSLGTAGLENSGDIISNNNIFDVLKRVSATSGINIDNNNTGWTISGNSLYETATIDPSVSYTFTFIQVNSPTGTNFTVSGNYIGGGAPACGGTFTKANSFDNTFYGISLNVGTSAASNVQGNIISAISWTNATTAGWYGIKVNAGFVNIGTTTGNTIGASTGTGSIVVTNATADGSVYGISLLGTGSVDVENNPLGAITTGNASTLATNFYGIYRSAATGSTTIKNNTIGSTATAGSINASSASTASVQSVYGIYCDAGNASVTIMGNTISKMTNGTTNSTAANAGLVDGIYAIHGSNHIINNTVRDLTIANANSSNSISATVIGIANSVNTANGQFISGNYIYNLSNTNTSFSGSVTGIYFTSSGAASSVTVAGNFINSLTVDAGSASASVYGINMASLATNTLVNNIISLGGNTRTTLLGIYESGTSTYTNKTYFNTVYLGGVPTSGSNPSYAFFSASSADTRDVKNNIFANARSTTGGSNLHYAAFFNYGVNTSLTLDYNDYYTPGTGGVPGYYNGANVTSLPLVPGKDAGSLMVNPVFANAGGTQATDYMPSAAYLAGIPGTGINTDFAGAAKSCTYPAMGAYEYTVQPCINPTGAGTISADQSGCGSFDPAAITGTSPTGHSGNLEYQWQQSTSSSSAGFQAIASSNAANYDPGVLTATTWFRRLARVDCKSDWTGAAVSNVVTMTIYPNLTTSISGGTSPICYNNAPGTFTATGSGGTGTYTYQWYRNGSLISGATSSTYAPENITTTTGYYCAVTSGSCGTVNTSTTTITVYGNLSAAISGGTTPICYNTAPGTFTATGTCGRGSYTYQWYTTSGIVTGATNSTYSPGNITVTTGYYCAITSGSCGTVNTYTTTISVNGNLTAGISGGTTPICYNSAPGTFTATGSGGTGSYTYQWYTTSGIVTGATNSTYSSGNITVTTGYYCAITSGSCGTVNTNTTTITVYGNLSAAISGGTTPICYNTAPGTFTATGTGGRGSYTYQWFTTSGIVTGATNSTYSSGNITVTTGYYCAITSGSCGTINTNTTTITVYDNLTAAISGGTSPVCYNSAPGTLTATGSGGTNSYGYQWYSTSGVIDGATNSTYSPGNITTTTGYYCAITSGSCGPVNSATTNITVFAEFTSGSISTTGETICFNGDPGLIASSAAANWGDGNITYRWLSSPTSGFTTSSVISHNAPSYDPPAGLSSTTWYRRQAKDATCNASWQSSDGTWQVVVYPYFSTGSISGNQTICLNTTPAQITGIAGTGGNAPYGYQWQNSSNNVNFTDIAGATNLNYQPGPLSSTTYYRQKQTSAGGCNAPVTNVVTITIYASTLVASVSVNPVCSGSSTTIYATGGSEYFWDHGLGLGSSKVVAPLANTTYSVTSTDANGCQGIAASISVMVNTTPVVQVEGAQNSSSTIVLGTSKSLTATGASTYLWNTSSSSAAISVSPAVATAYSVNGTTSSCLASATHTVNVASVSAGPSRYVCAGSSTTLTANVTGIVPTGYLWAPGGQTTQSITVTPLLSTNYSVTVTGITGLVSSVMVTVYPKPIANAGPDITIAPAATGALAGSATSGNAPYAWYWTTTGGTIVSGSTTATAQVNAAGTYTLQVTDSYGCSSTDIAVVTVDPGSATGTYPVSGNVAYAFNTVNNQMHDVTITLKQGGTTIYTATTPSTGNGNFLFPAVANGTYTVNLNTSKPWGGVTAADITLIQNHYKVTGATPLIGIKRLAADVVDNSSLAYVYSDDRDMINNKRLSPPTPFPTGNWVFTKAEDISAANGYPYGGSIKYCNSAGYSDITLTVSGIALSMDFRTLCYGDVDASYNGVKDNEVTSSNIITSAGLDLVNYPNPFTGRTTIRYTLPVAGSATLTVRTLLGPVIATIADPDDYEGIHNIEFDGSWLAPGIYLFTVELKTSDDTLIQTGKMVISR